jgi:hypothetical protein
VACQRLRHLDGLDVLRRTAFVPSVLDEGGHRGVEHVQSLRDRPAVDRQLGVPAHQPDDLLGVDEDLPEQYGAERFVHPYPSNELRGEADGAGHRLRLEDDRVHGVGRDLLFPPRAQAGP